MPEPAQPYILIDIPPRHIAQARIVELVIEEKGVLRLTRRARRILGVQPGDTIRFVPIQPGLVVVITPGRQLGQYPELR